MQKRATSQSGRPDFVCCGHVRDLLGGFRFDDEGAARRAADERGESAEWIDRRQPVRRVPLVGLLFAYQALEPCTASEERNMDDQQTRDHIRPSTTRQCFGVGRLDCVLPDFRRLRSRPVVFEPRRVP
jgi:hypothetical protein